MRYSEQFMEHIEYAFHAFCKIVLRHEADMFSAFACTLFVRVDDKLL